MYIVQLSGCVIFRTLGMK